MSWLWTVADQSDHVVLNASVPRGSVAFVEGGFEPELWGRTYTCQPAVERLAMAEFLATAHASAAAAAGGRSVTVIGEGLLAQLIRGVSAGDPPHGPDVIIDTTGSPALIRRAVCAAPRLGRLILAAPPRFAEIDLATYRDIHVRGLSIVGIAWRSGPAHSADPGVSMDAILASITPTLPGRQAPRSPLYILHSQEPM